MAEFPNDILINIIFPQLDSDNLAKCSRVCKQWRQQIKNFLNKKEHEELKFSLLKLEDAYLSDSYKKFLSDVIALFVLNKMKVDPVLVSWNPTYELSIHHHVQIPEGSKLYNARLVWRIPFDGNIPRVYRHHMYDYLVRKIQTSTLTRIEILYLDYYAKLELNLKVMINYLSRHKNIDFGYHPNMPQLYDDSLTSVIKELDP